MDDVEDEDDACREKVALGCSFPAALAGLELGATGAGLPIDSLAGGFRFPRFCGGGMTDERALLADADISPR